MQMTHQSVRPLKSFISEVASGPRSSNLDLAYREMRARAERITPRQLVYLQLAADGYRKQDIARELGVKESTVKNLHHEISLKLGADSLLHAVAIGFRKQILE